MSKPKCPEFENHERWLVSYADMLTLLFAVFVVLFALKEGGEPQVQRAAGAMQESFNTPLEDIPIDRQSGPGEQGLGIFEHMRGDAILPPVVQKYPSRKQAVKIIDQVMKQVELQLEERLYGPNKFRDPEKPGQERIISVHRTEKGFTLRLLARHFYTAGGVQIRREALKDLDQVIELVKGLGQDVTIEGHTDSMPPKGENTNWEISVLRATFLVRYMIRDHNFPQTRLTAAGYADLKPIAHNGTEEGRSLNRRVEIHVNYE